MLKLLLDRAPCSSLTVVVLATLSLALGCAESGGGSSSTSAATRSEGAVALLLTDAPADPSLFSEIHLVVERIELIGENDGRELLYEGEGQAIDLLDLRTHSLPFGLQRGSGSRSTRSSSC